MTSKVKANWKVVGHHRILEFLERTIVNDSTAHALLLVGPRTVGKMSIAKQFANFIICENNTGKDTKLEKLGCGQCPNCLTFSKGLYADYYLLERDVDEKTGKSKQNISVKQVRELQTRLSKHSFQNSYKIVIVPEAETMSEEASNSLLKFLEEPTPKTIIMLLTPSKDIILPTIISRCQMLNFPVVSREDIYQELIKRGNAPDVALEIASIAEGRTTLAFKFNDDAEFYKDYKEKIKKILTLLQSSKSGRFIFIDKMVSKNYSKENALETLNVLSSLLRDIELIKNNSERFLSHRYLKPELRELAGQNIPAKQLLQEIEKSRKLIYQNVSIKFVFENLLI